MVPSAVPSTQIRCVWQDRFVGRSILAVAGVLHSPETSDDLCLKMGYTQPPGLVWENADPLEFGDLVPGIQRHPRDMSQVVTWVWSADVLCLRIYIAALNLAEDSRQHIGQNLGFL